MYKKFLTTVLIGAGILGGLTFSTESVKADAIKGVVTTNKVARLYTKEGKLISTRALSAHTPWITNRVMDLPEVGSAYQVATNEFVKAEDVELQHGTADKGVINSGNNGALVYSFSNGTYNATDRKLAANSRWQYSRTDNNGGKTWYQVAPNAWINSDDASTSLMINNTGTIKISYAPNSGIDLYTGFGNQKTATGKKLTNGSEWKFYKKVIDVNGDTWYEIGSNQWINGYFTKITNTSFDQSAAETWDPNYAALKVTQDTDIYSDSNWNAGTRKRVYAGSLVQVDSTVQDGNTIWYEMSNGGWLPSSAVSTVKTDRPIVSLNGKSKAQAVNEVIAAAKQQLGKPYVWNGKGPENFDCSGLMQYVFREVTGQNIGSWTVPQESAGTQVSLNELQPGDLLFWGPKGASYHVALYLGNNQYLNALRPGTNVKIDSISSAFAPSFGVRVLK